MIIKAEAASAFEELYKDGRVRGMSDPDAPISFPTARVISAADYVKALRIRTLCQQAMAEFFSEWDVLIAPAYTFTAPAADKTMVDLEWTDPIGGMSTLCGLPALSVPCGFGRGGLPAGLTIVGGAFEEAKILALGKLFQTLTDWHRRRPPLR